MLTMPAHLDSLEQWLALLVEGSEHEKAGQWFQAEVAYKMVRTFRSRDILSLVASQQNRSTNTIRSWVAAYHAFPHEADRVPTLHFTHHCIAALTEDPALWIGRAADEQWTTQQLRAAIRRAKDPYNAAFDRQVMEQQIQRLSQEYNTTWGTERQCEVAFRNVALAVAQ